MRLVFAGTPEFAERTLARLVAAGHEIVMVLTQPDRPSGRGLRLTPSPVKRFAAAHGMEVFQPRNLRSASDLERVRAARPDALVVAAYGLLLPEALLAAGRHGALNVHASLLPRWRGAAPVQRALLAGDGETGISIMQMDAGLDTGPVLLQARMAIEQDDDAGTLHDRLAEMGARMMVAVLEQLEAGLAVATPQVQAGVTYAHKIQKQETRLDWSRPAAVLERCVRAFRPAPGAFTELDGEAIKVWRARVVKHQASPGTLIGELVVACGEDALELTELQRAGGKRLGAAQFLRGRPLQPGTRFQ